jgi:hypothetical protein
MAETLDTEEKRKSFWKRAAVVGGIAVGALVLF